MSATQSAFRVRNDDGNETTATWMAALNTNTLPTLDANFRVRLQSTVDGEAIVDFDVDLYYTLNSTNIADRVSVTTSSIVVKAVNSASITNGEATTEQLAGANGFTAGEVSEDGLCTGIAIDGLISPADTEHEFVIQLLSAGRVNGDIVRLYLTYNDNATVFDTYSQIPTFTFSGLAGGEGGVVGGGVSIGSIVG